MADAKIIHEQLKKLKFGSSPWNQAEIRELPKIIHDGEDISECVNGFYEGGVALLVATEQRLLLIDKKPLRFLTVEDFRFDMINEIDYSHRLVNATVTISTGSKTLKFTSPNQPRLRHLITLVQEHMSSGKKSQSAAAQNQQQHLQEINQQLQMYLMAQHQYLQQQMQGQAQPAQAPRPSPQLSDYLFAHQLLDQFQKENGTLPMPVVQQPTQSQPAPAHATEPAQSPVSQADLVTAARQEVFGGVRRAEQASPTSSSEVDNPAGYFKGLEINPLRIAYSRLPMMLRNRKFGRPYLQGTGQSSAMPTSPQT